MVEAWRRRAGNLIEYQVHSTIRSNYIAELSACGLYFSTPQAKLTVNREAVKKNAKRL